MTARALQIRADFDDLPRLAEWAERQARDLGLGERRLYAIQLCLEEVVANLVMHAKPAAGPEVRVVVRIEGDPLRVTVEDDALPFDVTEMADAAPAASLDEATMGGLGLGLVRGFSTSLDYVSEAGRNRLTMGFA